MIKRAFPSWPIETEAEAAALVCARGKSADGAADGRASKAGRGAQGDLLLPRQGGKSIAAAYMVEFKIRFKSQKRFIALTLRKAVAV